MMQALLTELQQAIGAAWHVDQVLLSATEPGKYVVTVHRNPDALLPSAHRYTCPEFEGIWHGPTDEVCAGGRYQCLWCRLRWPRGAGAT